MDYVLLFNDLLARDTQRSFKTVYLTTLFRPKAAMSLQLTSDGKFYVRFVAGNEHVERDARNFVKKGQKAYNDSTAVRMSLDAGEVAKLGAYLEALVNLAKLGQYNVKNAVHLMSAMQMFMHDIGSSAFKIMHTTNYNGKNERKELIVSVSEDSTLYFNLAHYVEGQRQGYYSVGINLAGTDLFLLSSILNGMPVVMTMLHEYRRSVDYSTKYQAAPAVVTNAAVGGANESVKTNF